MAITITMQSNLLWSGVLLLAVGLSGITFFRDSPAPMESVAVKVTQVTQANLSKKKLVESDTEDTSSAVHISTKQKSISPKYRDTIVNNTSDDYEKEYRRIRAIEESKYKAERKRDYRIARREWRKSLNKARTEAKKNGDYTLYNSLKEQEPEKY